MEPDAQAAAGCRRVVKRIAIRPQGPALAEHISAQFNLSAVTGRVLAARGFSLDTELRSYLQPTLKDGLPHPEGLKGLDSACALIWAAVDQGKRFAICCDFDVDGLCGGSMLHGFFSQVGVQSKVFVPDRFLDGYGLNRQIVDTAADEGFQVLITIDFGTTNKDELAHASARGLQTVVIDHHHVASAPPADVFINPQQEGCGFAQGALCAAGLVWYLLIALNKNAKKKQGRAPDVDVKSYLDLACLATICDMVPLRGVNRVIAKRGLEMLSMTHRPGLRALKNIIGIPGEVSCSHVAFGIGPRINAAGRIVHGELVTELLTTVDSKRADTIAKRLHRLNLERQDIETRIKNEAIRRVMAMKQLPHGIVVWDRNFHTGVIGIVAQRLVEAFYRPALVIGCDNGVFKGSARGIKGFSVVEALGSISDVLLRYGGHAGAGGFSVEEGKLVKLADAFEAECRRRLADVDLEPRCDADTSVTLNEIDASLVDELAALAPFGTGNPAPVLHVPNVRVHDIRVLKGSHLKMTVSDGKRHVSALLWQHTSHPALYEGALVQLACRPGLNSYNGLLEIQLQIQAVEPWQAD